MPAGKLWIEIDTPRFRILWRLCVALSRSCTSDVSVISSHSLPAGKPVAARVATSHVGMLPPRQGFDADHDVVVEPDDRLIVDDELALVGSLLDLCRSGGVHMTADARGTLPGIGRFTMTAPTALPLSSRTNVVDPISWMVAP